MLLASHQCYFLRDRHSPQTGVCDSHSQTAPLCRQACDPYIYAHVLWVSRRACRVYCEWHLCLSMTPWPCPGSTTVVARCLLSCCMLTLCCSHRPAPGGCGQCRLLCLFGQHHMVACACLQLPLLVAASCRMFTSQGNQHDHFCWQQAHTLLLWILLA
jgi:hypothetical protein